MTFDVVGAAYDRYMGRYSTKLAPQFVELAGITSGMYVLDVGCGTGALTAELVQRCGPARVAAVEPSQPLLDAARARFPGVDIRHAPAERLPFADGELDAALAQLVLAFVTDADAAAAELKRVVRPGGIVAACMWQAGELQLADIFWRAAAQTVDPSLRDREASMPFRKQGDIAALWKRAGLRNVQESMLEVTTRYQDFDDFWQPMLNAAGPIGAFMKTADAATTARLRDACFDLLGRPAQPFELRARACAARALV